MIPMSRWHEPHCAHPNVKILDDLLFCWYCFAYASTKDVVSGDSSQGVRIPALRDDAPLNLKWPPSVFRNGSLDHTSFPSDGVVAPGVDKSLRARCIQTVNTAGEVVTCKRGSRSVPGYAKLDHNQEIRVLRLDPSCQGDLVHADLVSRRLDDDEPSYEAVSYTWADEDGETTRCRSIFVGVYWDIYPVTRNCEGALLSIREEEKVRSVWVDSICINQDDMDERSAQVNLMPRIYSRAAKVLLYLGEPTPDIKDAFQGLDRQHYVGIFGSTNHHPLECQCAQCTTEAGALDTLFDRPYFKRLWVVQELVLAQTVVVYCGARSTEWPLRSMIGDKYPGKSVGPSWTRFRDTRDSIRRSDILSLLVDTTACLCADPRDKVFALLGLIRFWEQEPILPDYTLTIKEVYIGIAAFLVQKCGMGAEVLASSTILGTTYRLPSWVPDWGAPVVHSRTYQAGTNPAKGSRLHWTPPGSDGHEQQHASGVAITSDRGALEITGIKLRELPGVMKPLNNHGLISDRLISITWPDLILDIKNLVEGEHLFWLHDIKTYAVLRSTGGHQYTLVSLCKLDIGQGPSWTFQHMSDWPKSDMKTIIDLYQAAVEVVYSDTGSPQESTKTPEVLLEIAVRGVGAALSCIGLKHDALEESFAGIWRALYLRWSKILNDDMFEFLKRNIPSAILTDDIFSLGRGRVDGFRESVDHILWSMILDTDSKITLTEELQEVEEDVGAIFKEIEMLTEGMEKTEKDLASFMDPLNTMRKRWPEIFPGLDCQIYEKWSQNYETFIQRSFPGPSTPYDRATYILNILKRLRDARRFREGVGGTKEDEAFRNTFLKEMNDVLWDWPQIEGVLARRRRLWDFLASVKHWVSCPDGRLQEQIYLRAQMYSYGLDPDAWERISIL